MQTLETMIRDMAHKIAAQEVLAAVKGVRLTLNIDPASSANDLPPVAVATVAAPLDVPPPKATPSARPQKDAAPVKRGPGRPRKNPVAVDTETVALRGEVSVTTAAKFAGVSPNTVYAAIEAKELKAKEIKAKGRGVRGGKKTVLQAADVREWAKNR